MTGILGTYIYRKDAADGVASTKLRILRMFTIIRRIAFLFYFEWLSMNGEPLTAAK